jgi:hypothetical protein
MLRRTLLIVVFVALVSAGPAFSQCGDPSNILSNDLCGFDSAASVNETTGWWNMVPEMAGDPEWGTVVQSATGGRTSAGTMSGTSYDNGAPPMGWGSLLGARYCMPLSVTSGDTLGFGGWANITSGTVNQCSVVLFTSGSTDCSSGALDQAFRDNTTIPAGVWTKINDTNVTLTATQDAVAVEIRLSCTANADFTVNLDDAYIGPDMVPVQLQSFSIE